MCVLWTHSEAPGGAARGLFLARALLRPASSWARTLAPGPRSDGALPVLSTQAVKQSGSDGFALVFEGGHRDWKLMADSPALQVRGAAGSRRAQPRCELPHFARMPPPLVRRAVDVMQD